MPVSTFEKILQDAYKTGMDSKKAGDWLWNQSITKQGNVTGKKLLKENPANLFNIITPAVIGRMVFYQYDAKTAAKLPYWDRYPLIFVVDMTPGGFFGLNVHYLSPLHRAKLMDNLYSVLNNDKFDDSTRLKISYQILKAASKFKLFKPCFKHYLSDHVRSQFLYIAPEEWAIATFLPTARFQKARDTTVWNDSNNIANHNQSLPKNSKNRK
jgi:hypothetical protein